MYTNLPGANIYPLKFSGDLMDISFNLCGEPIETIEFKKLERENLVWESPSVYFFDF